MRIRIASAKLSPSVAPAGITIKMPQPSYAALSSKLAVCTSIAQVVVEYSYTHLARAFYIQPGKAFSDSFTPLETLAFNIATAFTTTATTLDTPALAVGRAVADSATVADLASVRPTKAPVDTITTSDDAPVFDVDAVRADLVATSDLFAYLANTQFSDTTTAADVLALLPAIGLADTTNPVDAQVFEYLAQHADSVTTTEEVVAGFIYTRVFEDDSSDQAPLIVSNDPLPPTLIPRPPTPLTDLIVFNVAVPHSDSATPADTLVSVSGYTRQFADPATASEVYVFAVGSVLADSATTADTPSLSPEFTLQDSATSQEANTFSIQAVRTDIATTVDSFDRVVAYDYIIGDDEVVTVDAMDAISEFIALKQVVDFASAVDAADTTFDAERTVADIGTSSDSLFFAVSAVYQDNVTAVEALARVVAFDRVFADTVSVNDVVVTDHVIGTYTLDSRVINNNPLNGVGTI